MNNFSGQSVPVFHHPHGERRARMINILYNLTKKT